MRSIAKIMATARELWPLYLTVVIGAVATSATALLTPFVIARATDTVIDIAEGRGGTVADLMWLAVILLIIALANSAITNVSGYFGDLMSVRLRAILSANYYRKLLRLPQRYYDNELTGTIISRLNRSITSITDFLQTFSNGFFPTVITLLAVLVITAFYSPWLSVLLIVIYPTFVWLTALTSKKWQVWEKQKNDHYDISGGRFSEVIGQMRVVKSFVTERRELDSFRGHYRDAVDLTRRQSRFWHTMDMWRRGALDLVFFGIYAIIFWQTATGQYSVGTMVLLIQLTTMARMPVTSMSYWVDMTQRAVAGSLEYFKVMDEADEPNNPLEAAPSAEVQWVDSDPVVEFDDVSFGYGDGDDLVLRDIDLTVNRGERIAFVGESGGGKTTLVNLIMKLYPVTSGTVRVHGQSVDDVPTAELRREIGVVFQDANLFSGTIRENMAYGQDDVTDEQLAVAARRANAMTFISHLHGGFDTEIGERGIKLSGGQKQRLSVARALLKDAPILILDEATSSLDTKSERAVQAGLEELMEGRTTLIIAHRLSTISTVDRIVTLRDGRIDEIGTPAELATTGGIYAELLALQGSTRKADKARLLRYDITQ
ncbi:iron ABC transporter ATP-binding protein [Tessaracoccus lapidicaptus]|uniref:Iron ABC transporter ATP-binding protein n=1 Tax=Tessaracoccus lapidicaptus TaxID=1427523 RepID=A0A1C0AKU6_9ACTN|nr:MULTISPECIES: ABC transporter ATP-binding protein [Tessaracoccus]AQX15990.1 iron ABC transporter ATP-binding protein [Tessaracoccus sp. T2.5-30]OCL33291.1 iron ABC transporter ATP-binding protein [Tessaracoccus lapidicaptus]VEP40493.1 Putative multidrug export ATP-binding/permease protein [Tessaracoccus lapidicaptus]